MTSTQSIEERIKLVEKHIKSYPDFPKEGILFRDIFSAMLNGSVCKTLQGVIVEYAKLHFPDVEVVVGLESRGFLFCFSLAAELGLACMPVRKKGKLPGKVLAYDYTLEYGSNTFEIQIDAIEKTGLKCLIIDDLLATGGSMLASIRLLRMAGVEVIGCLAIMELLDLKGKDKIPEDIPFHSLIKY